MSLDVDASPLHPVVRRRGHAPIKIRSTEGPYILPVNDRLKRVSM